MSKNLYNEAIAEAKQLRDMAEQNAKNKIIEAVTPRIRSLIEQQLIDDVEEESDLVIGDEEVSAEEEMVDLAVDDLPMPAPVEDTPAAAPTVSITVQGDLEMELGENDDEEEDLILSQESFLRLENFLHNVSKTKNFSGRVISLSKRFNMLREAIDGVNLNKCTSIEKQTAIIFYGRLLEEVITLSNNLILMKESIDNRLELQLTQLIKEMSIMSRRRDAAAFRRLFEELTKDESLEEVGMFEQDDEEVELDTEIEVDEEVEVAAEPDVAAAEDALLDLGAALGLDVEVEPAEETVEVEEDVEEEEEITLEGDHEEDADEMDEVYEIDESSLRRELLKMRRLREQEEGRAAAADPALAHGGEDEGDVIIDVDEDALLNALADELGDPGVPTPQVEAFIRRRLRRASRQLAESQRRGRTNRRSRARSRRIAETRGSKRAVMAERTVTKLKKQLAEMNLFNAKLLFANKLMQNRGLSTKQQRVVVEALDKARTIREAKLLYKSLSASLNRGSGKTLSESRSRLLASSSKSTRSGAPANNGNEVDRWALLAGLTSDK